jgi:hypothetical protein
MANCLRIGIDLSVVREERMVMRLNWKFLDWFLRWFGMVGGGARLIRMI